MPIRMTRGAAPVEARSIEAERLTGAGAVIVAPHPDDEVLGCGGLLASAPDPTAVRVIVVTDGHLSPPAGGDDPTLPERRLAESRAALARLGIPAGNLRGAALPDGDLRRQVGAVVDVVRDIVRSFATPPRSLLVPFRFDRHPDHVACYQAGVRVAEALGCELWEYFVYPTWKTMRPSDIRWYLDPGGLRVVRLREEARSAKREALERYTSQTRIGYPGQTRPVLSEEFLDVLCGVDEYFLASGLVGDGDAVLGRRRLCFALARRFEPPLKRARDRLFEFGFPG